MARLVFGEDEARSITAIVVDMVAELMADGLNERAARARVAADLREQYRSGDNCDQVVDAFMTSATTEYVRQCLRKRGHNRGPKVIVNGKKGALPSSYAVPSGVISDGTDLLVAPLVQDRWDTLAMGFVEARLALANQRRGALAHTTRVDRLEALINALQNGAPDAPTLGEAAALLGMTAELMDLSDLLDAQG